VLDSFAGGLAMQSLLPYWFHVTYGVSEATLRDFLRSQPALGGLRAGGAWIAGRIGLINTMVWTHLPSNVLLILVRSCPAWSWRSPS